MREEGRGAKKRGKMEQKEEGMFTSEGKKKNIRY
jgi:hypothetical protein